MKTAHRYEGVSHCGTGLEEQMIPTTTTTYLTAGEPGGTLVSLVAAKVTTFGMMGQQPPRARGHVSCTSSESRGPARRPRTKVKLPGRARAGASGTRGRPTNMLTKWKRPDRMEKHPRHAPVRVVRALGVVVSTVGLKGCSER